VQSQGPGQENSGAAGSFWEQREPVIAIGDASRHSSMAAGITVHAPSQAASPPIPVGTPTAARHVSATPTAANDAAISLARAIVFNMM
jgi:hypothetical protein